MKLEMYIETLVEPLKQATLCFLVFEDMVLLAMKKRGFGAGKFNGIGGKREFGETIEESAVREIREEIGVNVYGLRKMATLNCYFPDNPGWGQQVSVFVVDRWEGEPIETEEMAPKWFSKDSIPFKQMWPDEEQWLPLVLGGENVEAEYLFDKDGNILDSKIINSGRFVESI